MSARSTIRDERASRSRDGYASDAADGGRLERTLPGLATPIRVACFWSAIVLPFLHVPILATGLETVAETITFSLLVGLNVLALFVGHPHRN